MRRGNVNINQVLLQRLKNLILGLGVIHRGRKFYVQLSQNI